MQKDKSIEQGLSCRTIFMEVRYYDLPFGITTIDTGFVRPGFDASHLIVENGQAAFVDVGTSYAVPVLLEVLRRKQIPTENVQYVIVTHIHLDHAGGAGVLMKHLPNAKLVAHPRGARHLISPERLMKGTTAVYGAERTKALFGDIIPVSRERVIEATDEYRLSLSGRELLCPDTPGHARHHVCVVDKRSQGIFSGDTFGISFREFDTENGSVIFPICAPVHFDPEKMHASIDKLMTYQPKRIYLTHFGCVTGVPRLADEMHQGIDQFAALAQSVTAQGDKRRQELTEGMEQIFLARIRSHGCELDQDQILKLLASDIAMNVRGLEVWIDKSEKREGK